MTQEWGFSFRIMGLKLTETTTSASNSMHFNIQKTTVLPQKALFCIPIRLFIQKTVSFI